MTDTLPGRPRVVPSKVTESNERYVVFDDILSEGLLWRRVFVAAGSLVRRAFGAGYRGAAVVRGQK